MDEAPDYLEASKLTKGWLTPLSQICTIVLVISIVGVIASGYYVGQLDAVRSETPAINFLKGQEMVQDKNKFLTETSSWIVVGFSAIGLLSGITREWSRHKRRKLDRQLEQIGVFPPPGQNVISRIFRRG